MAYINVDEVYILDNTGLQVDMATDIPFVDAGFTDAQKEQARKNIAAGGTNPNLLDNPWWGSGEVVNQRAVTSGSTTNGAYSIDRWKMSYGSAVGTWSVGATGTTITAASGTYAVFQQQLENPTALDGKTVTLSAMLADGTIISGTTTWDTSTGLMNVITSGSVRLGTVSGGLFRVAIMSGGSATIRAVKLELGSVSTLANDVAPDYGTELLKCQRYFVRLKNLYSIVGTGYALNATTPWFFAPTPVPLRDGVALTSTINGLYVAAISGFHAVSAIAIQNSGTSYSASGVFFNATTTGLSSGEVCMLQVRDANGYLDFSADL